MIVKNIELPSIYAQNGKIEAKEITIHAELDSSYDVVFLINARNEKECALLYHSHNINEMLGKLNDIVLELLNRQAFELSKIKEED